MTPEKTNFPTSLAGIPATLKDGRTMILPGGEGDWLACEYPERPADDLVVYDGNCIKCLGLMRATYEGRLPTYAEIPISEEEREVALAWLRHEESKFHD